MGLQRVGYNLATKPQPQEKLDFSGQNIWLFKYWANSSTTVRNGAARHYGLLGQCLLGLRGLGGGVVGVFFWMGLQGVGTGSGKFHKISEGLCFPSLTSTEPRSQVSHLGRADACHRVSGESHCYPTRVRHAGRTRLRRQIERLTDTITETDEGKRQLEQQTNSIARSRIRIKRRQRECYH